MSLETPKQEGQPPSPSRKPDGIDLTKQHLGRLETLQNIYAIAKTNNLVVLGSPPSTGKTSLLQLLDKKIQEEKNANVIRFSIRTGEDDLIQYLADCGITSKVSDLRKLQNTWLLIDDSQNGYSDDYKRFWEIVVKDSSSEYELFVVISATHDLTTSPSPVSFGTLKHVDPSLSPSEAKELIKLHLDHWDFTGWSWFENHLLELSKQTEDGNTCYVGVTYHVGVIMAAIRALDERKARYKKMTEEEATDLLREPIFISQLERCYHLDAKELTREVKGFLEYALLSQPSTSQEDFTESLVGPLVRAGILNRDGNFSCLAANWYYNKNCFPGRPLYAPDTLRDLIIQSIRHMSARRLRDAAQSGFPKEAAFQHLMNEAMSAELPAGHSIIPEFNTVATDSQDPSAEPVTGELDFYVNGSKQWCIEMLREGKAVGEHLGRLKDSPDSSGNKGKYRKVQKKEYYVIDCRGPKKQRGANVEDNKCTLYFEEDFSSCLCEMKGFDDLSIPLQM